MSLLGVLVGVVSGAVGWWVPSALGGGQHLVEVALGGQVALAHIPWWCMLRVGLMLLSYGCGAAGDIFAPPYWSWGRSSGSPWVTSPSVSSLGGLSP